MQPTKLIPAVSKTLTKTMMPYPIGKGKSRLFRRAGSGTTVWCGLRVDPNGVKRELPLRFTDGTESVISVLPSERQGGRKDKRLLGFPLLTLAPKQVSETTHALSSSVIDRLMGRVCPRGKRHPTTRTVEPRQPT